MPIRLLIMERPLKVFFGRNFLAAIASKPSGKVTSNDDWAISPEFTVDSSGWLSFYASSLSSEYGYERLKVLVSTNGTATSSFKKINSSNYIVVPVGWTFYKFDLSDYQGQKIRFALNCVSSDAFMLMIDKIVVSKEEPFSASSLKSSSSFLSSSSTGLIRKQVSSPQTLATSSSGIDGAVRYEVYRNGELIATQQGFASNTFTDVTDECGLQSYQIKAFSSVTSNQVESSSVSLLNCLEKANVSSGSSAGSYMVQLPDGVSGASYYLYNVNGQQVDKGIIDSFQFNLNLSYLPRGIYIMKILYPSGSEAIKLIKE
ncbi:MAG: choice-of-anchor J domain-containing protein [Breznakibacter sp.]